jgi:hypothetical protein
MCLALANPQAQSFREPREITAQDAKHDETGAADPERMQQEIALVRVKASAGVGPEDSAAATNRARCLRPGRRR